MSVQITVEKVGVKKGDRRELNFKSHLEDTTPAVGKYNRRMNTLRSMGEDEFSKVIAQKSLAELDEAVGTILDDEGIIGPQRIPYRNFARKIWHLARKYGFVKTSTLNSIRDYFRSEGANERILRRIESIFLVPVKEAKAGAGGGAGGAITE